jgi:hypothetical protein
VRHPASAYLLRPLSAPSPVWITLASIQSPTSLRGNSGVPQLAFPVAHTVSRPRDFAAVLHDRMEGSGGRERGRAAWTWCSRQSGYLRGLGPTGSRQCARDGCARRSSGWIRNASVRDEPRAPAVTHLVQPAEVPPCTRSPREERIHRLAPGSGPPAAQRSAARASGKCAILAYDQAAIRPNTTCAKMLTQLRAIANQGKSAVSP